MIRYGLSKLINQSSSLIHLPGGIVKNGLVAEYRFDEGSGQVLTDYRGGYNGQLGSTAGSDTNDPTWGTEGLTFATDDYVTCGNPSAFNFAANSQITLITVAKTTAVGAQSLLLKGRDAIAFNYNMSLSGTSLRAGNTLNDVNIGTVQANTFQFLASVWDGTNVTGWVNKTKGSPVAMATAAPDIGPLNIGGPAQGYLNGAMAYALLYNRQLSDGEMTQNYNALKAKVVARGIVLP